MTTTDPRTLLNEGRKHDEAMTQGRAVAGLYRSDDLDEQVAQFREAHAKYAGQPMHVVAVAASDKPIESDAICFATTGNGPHGATDAAGIAWLRTNLRVLLDLAELGVMSHERDHRPFAPGQRDLVIEVCHDLINRAMRNEADQIPSPSMAADARAKEAAIRALLDGYATAMDDHHRLKSENEQLHTLVRALRFDTDERARLQAEVERLQAEIDSDRTHESAEAFAARYGAKP